MNIYIWLTTITQMKLNLIVITLIVCPVLTMGQCFVSGFGSLGTLYNSTGNAVLDTKFRASKADLESVFGVSTQLFIYDDSSSPNAFAMENDGSYDGLVAFGQNLLVARLWNRDKGEAAVAGILAHEFGHVLQMKKGFSGGNSPQKELQADFLAGYYLGHRNYAQSSIQAVGADLYSIGDYDFGSSTHHGTPAERVNAMLAGYSHRYNSVDDAYDAGLNYINGNSNGNGNGNMVLVPCTHPAHPNGDLYPCEHVMHPNGDLYPCTHTCMGPYGYVLCHPAGDIGPCTHRLHASDVVACTHPMHPAGDWVSQ